MDVLELPRPVINFLRTMTKEGCRYVLSWDIFGGTDTVTLTLTWKLSDDHSQVSISKSPQEQIYDELQIRHNDSISSPRRSRRDENIPTSIISRSSRGKSLEENNLSPNKRIIYHQPQVSSLERSSILNRQKKESDPIYANLNNVKYASNPSPSSSLNNNLPLSIVHTQHRYDKQQCETPTLRRFRPLIPVINNSTSSKLRRKNYVANRNDEDEDDDTLDPWVKRFECSLEDNTNEPIQQFKDDIDKTGITSGKVKFKRKPDYF